MNKNLKNKTLSALTACAITISTGISTSFFVAPQVYAEATNRMETAINWAVSIADDNSHGYSQSNRWGPDYDCSSLVIAALKQAGYDVGSATYTGNMRSNLTSKGFIWIPWSQIGSEENLQRGDILLNEKNHTEIYLGNSKNVGAHSNRGYPQGGDQTGTEISVGNYYSYPWNGVLRDCSSDSSNLNVANNTYIISSAVDSNLVFDVYGGETNPSSETPITSYTRHGNANQQFKFIPTYDKYFRISPLSDTTGNMALNIYGAEMYGRLQIYTYSEAENELFWLEDAGDNQYYIRCMSGTITLKDNSSGADIYLDQLDYSSKQKWTLTEVASNNDSELINQLKEDMRIVNNHRYNISYYCYTNNETVVKSLQRLLNYFEGSNLQVDGIAGTATRASIQKFQQHYGLSVDSIFGPRCKEKMTALVNAL